MRLSLTSIFPTVNLLEQSTNDGQLSQPTPHHHTYSLFPIRYLIVGLLSLGLFTTSMSGAIMNSTILAMAPPRNTGADVTTHNSGRHHRLHRGHIWQMHHSVRSHPKLHANVSVCVPTTSPSAVSSQPAEHLPQPEFHWSEQRQNLLLISYYIGFVAFLLPAGAVVEHYGGKWIAILGGLGHVLLNLATPSAARISYWCLFSLRIILGGLEAAVVPAFYEFITNWVPDDEKSKSMASISIGNSFGGIFLNLMSGFVCQNIGWWLVFYLVGIFNLLWLLLWWNLTTDQPASHPWMSSTELEYINSKTSPSTGPKEIPSVQTWLQIMQSKPVLGAIYVTITHSWFFGVLMAKMSVYMISVLRLNLEQTSIFNTIHQSVLLVSIFAYGILSDLITSRQCCPKTTTRKCFESLATFGTAFFMLLLTQTGCNSVAFIAVLALATACIGATTGGSDVIIFDLTSRHASILASLFASLNNVFSLFIPSLVTLILNQSTADHLQAQWNLIFYITAAVHCTGGLVFVLTGSAERQNWDEMKDEEE